MKTGQPVKKKSTVKACNIILKDFITALFYYKNNIQFASI